MGKNNKLINSLVEISRRNRNNNINQAADSITPQVYAAIAIALHRTYGFGYSRINKVFAESQNIWTEFAGRADDMIKLCENETGITIKGGN